MDLDVISMYNYCGPLPMFGEGAFVVSSMFGLIRSGAVRGAQLYALLAYIT